MLDAEWDGHATGANVRQLREFTLAWLVFFCALGAWQWIGHSDLSALAVLCAVGFSVGFVGLSRPRTVRPLFFLAMAVAASDRLDGYWIGAGAPLLRPLHASGMAVSEAATGPAQAREADE